MNDSALFDWSFAEKVDLGQLRHHQRFAFGAGECSSGLISDVEGRPGVHTHNGGGASFHLGGERLAGGGATAE